MSTIQEDCDELRELKELAVDAKAASEEATRAFKEAEQKLYMRMENEDTSSIKVGKTNFVRVSTLYGTVQDRDEFLKWARDNAPELIEEKERAGLINELVKERRDLGQVLPDGVGSYTRDYISQRVS